MDDHGIVCDITAIKKPRPKQDKSESNLNESKIIYTIILALISAILGFSG